jgi:hypothetical protein
MGVSRVSVEAGGPPSERKGAAHRPQKRVPEGFSKPQREQFTGLTALACSFADLEINKNAADSQLKWRPFAGLSDLLLEDLDDLEAAFCWPPLAAAPTCGMGVTFGWSMIVESSEDSFSKTAKARRVAKKGQP